MATILIFVGAKFVAQGFGIHVPILASLLAIVVIITVSIVVSLMATRGGGKSGGEEGDARRQDDVGF